MDVFQFRCQATDCTWTLSVPMGQQLQLRFTEFTLGQPGETGGYGTISLEFDTHVLRTTVMFDADVLETIWK